MALVPRAKQALCMRTGILALLTVLLLATPAGAVVGGTLQDPAAVPSYADVGNCGGPALAQPDQVAVPR